MGTMRYAIDLNAGTGVVEVSAIKMKAKLP